MKQNYILTLSAAMLCVSLAGTADAARREAPRSHGSMTASESVMRINSSKTPYLNGREAMRQNAPTSGWEVMGNGLYHDELFISYGMPAENWIVTVEQNTQSKGWYRFIPYNENSSVSELLGYPDDQYMYINAKNPNKVYAEDFTAYGIWLFSNVVAENDWDEAEQYGKLVDGIITWPAVNTFASYDKSWFYCMGETGVALYLPGSDFKDFSMDITTEHYCTDSNTHDILMTSGADIASFKHLTLPGNHYVDKEEANVAAQGITAPTEGGGAFFTIDLSDKEPGIYTTMIVGLDDKGNVRGSRQTHFIVPDNSIEWKKLGLTSFDEPFYYGVYDDFSPEPLEASIYEAEGKPGLYLIEDPYVSHTELGFELSDTHNHPHGLIVDATDPERVMVLPSSLGVCYDGDGAGWSLPSYFLLAGEDADAIAENGYFGTKTQNEDLTYTVEMPYGTLMIGEKNYYAGEFIDCDAPFSFIVPVDTSGVSSIDNDNEAETLYNLQGIPVPGGTKGAVIVRKGNSVTKRLNR